MKKGLVVTLTLLGLTGSCTGSISENRLFPTQLEVELVPAEVPLDKLGGFADQRGGGIFVDTDGLPVRLKVDGTPGPLESHPGNSVTPGAARQVFPAGPFSALVAAENGLYFAESGWLIEPAWRDAMSPDGVVAAALGADGVAWVAHRDGLFRIEAGALSELKVSGKAIKGISALAAAPAPDGSNAVWFAQGKKLSFARQTARQSYEVLPGGPSDEELKGGITGLAGVSAAPGSVGELWLITPNAVFQLADDGWVSFEPKGKPESIVSAGRFVWLRAGDTLYRYDADLRRWGEVRSLKKPATLLAADPSGSAWVLTDDGAFELRSSAAPRVLGLFESARVYQTDVLVRARIPASEEPETVSFALDDGKPVERLLADALPGDGSVATLDFALGGFDAAGREKTFSLAGIKDGMHTLTVTARTKSGESSRRLHFDYRSGDTAALSFAKDIEPIFVARCAKCHSMGPARELETYEQWVAEKERIVSAVVELRMPADGPLDPGQIQILQRWASGEAAP